MPGLAPGIFVYLPQSGFDPELLPTPQPLGRHAQADLVPGDDLARALHPADQP